MDKNVTKKIDKKRKRYGEAWDRHWIDDKGYSYHRTSTFMKNKLGQTVVYVRCIKDHVPKNGDITKKCTACGKFVDSKFEPSTKKAIHNHPPDPNLVEDRDFRKILKNSAKVFGASTKSVYTTASIEYPEAAARHPYEATRRLTINYKKGEQPLSTTITCANPNNLKTFAASLSLSINEEELMYGKQNQWKISTHYEEFVFTTNNQNKASQNLCIFDEEFLTTISSKVNHILVDATFRSVPHFQSKNIQFLTVMAKIDGESPNKSGAVPIFWAIMQNKGTDCYRKIFAVLKKKAGTLNPSSYMTDFEFAEHKAIEEAYPGIDIMHCFFHYAQAIMKNASDMAYINKTTIRPSTHPEIYLVLKQLIALALLPPNLIESTYQRIKVATTEDLGNHFDRFFEYYERYWLKVVKAKGFSVYNLRIDKTNNYVESYHRTLNIMLQSNPHPNQFFTILKYLLFNSRIVINSIELGKYVRKAPEKKYKEQLKENEEFWDILDEIMEYDEIDIINGLELINELKAIKKLIESKAKKFGKSLL